MMVWQSEHRNEWATAIRQALVGDTPIAKPPVGADPFSLADEATVESLLTQTWFIAIDFTDVNERVDYGANTTEAYDMVRDMRMTKDLLATLKPPAAQRALARLRELLAAHDTGSGVLFDSRTWIVTALKNLPSV